MAFLNVSGSAPRPVLAVGGGSVVLAAAESVVVTRVVSSWSAISCGRWCIDCGKVGRGMGGGSRSHSGPTPVMAQASPNVNVLIGGQMQIRQTRQDRKGAKKGSRYSNKERTVSVKVRKEGS